MTDSSDLLADNVNTPLLVFLADPNGAGKSTFYDMYLASQRLTFINADVIAKALKRAQQNKAVSIDRLAFEKAEELRRVTMTSRQSFCTETVFSDPEGAKLHYLREAREKYGYSITLIFIGIDVDLSVAPVMQRVSQGGHDIPDEKLARCYPRTMANLPSAIPLVDTAFVFDNSSDLEPYRLVARYDAGHLMEQGYIAL